MYRNLLGVTIIVTPLKNFFKLFIFKICKRKVVNVKIFGSVTFNFTGPPQNFEVYHTLLKGAVKFEISESCEGFKSNS